MPRPQNSIDLSRGPVAQLATELRALRTAAGTPTYRELAARAGYSLTVLSQAAAGRNLPSWPVVRAFVEACNGNIGEWKRRWDEVERAQRAHDLGQVAEATTQRPDEPPVNRPATTSQYAAAPQLLPDGDVAAHQETHRQAPSHADQRQVVPISVFLLDDHQIVRAGIRQLLEKELGIEVVGEAGTATEALTMIPALHPDVAILDVRLPDGDGISVCREIRSSMEPPPACLMLTSYADDQALFDAVMGGAAGYLLKQASGTDIVAAVRIVAGGVTLFSADITASLLARLRTGSQEGSRSRALTAQERKILDLIADGMTNRQISAKLFLAEKTVKNYVSSMLEKLGFDSRADAAEFAEKQRAERMLAVLADRDRIARDLHDLVIQRLFATGMSLQAAAPRIVDPQARTRVSRAVESLDEIVREIRTAIFHLQGAPDDSSSSSQRHRMLDIVAELNRVGAIDSAVRISGPVDTLPDTVGLHSEAVLREAVSNVLRHSHATDVTVTIDAGDYLTVVVEDNGVGLPVNVARSGLASIEQRAAQCQGTLSVGPRPSGDGTRLSWRVPLLATTLGREA